METRSPLQRQSTSSLENGGTAHFTVLPALIFGAGGLATGFLAVSRHGSDIIPAALVAAFLLALAAYFFGVALRSRLVIEGTRIEVRGAFRERSADLGEIEGFRTVEFALRLVPATGAERGPRRHLHPIELQNRRRLPRLVPANSRPRPARP